MRNRIYNISNSDKSQNSPDPKRNKYHSSQTLNYVYWKILIATVITETLDEFYC